MKLFSPDSMFMRVMTIIADFILLNLLTVLFSVPLFTAGAAATALYTVMGKLVRDEDYEIKDFFKAFKENFKQSTVAWLIISALALVLAGSFVFAGVLGSTFSTVISCIVYGMALLLLIAYSWTFPLLSQFDNKGKDTLSNALKIGIGNLPRSLVMCVLNILPWAFLYFKLDYFFRFGLFWVIVWFSIAAYFNCLLTKKPLAPYRKAGLAESAPTGVAEAAATTDCDEK